MDEEVLVQTEGVLGTLTLNRPAALNSLTLGMVTRIAEVLSAWSAPDSGVACVLVAASGGKAFCAGGDVKAVAQACRAGDTSLPQAFFKTEYEMDLQISRLPIPFVSLLDGIVMGGGAGLSMHGRFRVATERTVFAMPECAIGLFPDVGASHFLGQLPGHLGLYLGLTGARLSGVTLREAGLATHYLPSAALPQLRRRLQALGTQAGSAQAVARVLDEMEQEHGPLPAGTLAQLLPLVNRHFNQPSMGLVLKSLRHVQHNIGHVNGKDLGQGGQPGSVELDFVQTTLTQLSKGSPLAQVVTFELFRRAARASLVTCLEADLQMILRFWLCGGDVLEGVTALLVDKRPAVWGYKTVGEVPEAAVESFFTGGPFARQFSSVGRVVTSLMSHNCSSAPEADCLGPGISQAERLPTAQQLQGTSTSAYKSSSQDLAHTSGASLTRVATAVHHKPCGTHRDGAGLVCRL